VRPNDVVDVGLSDQVRSPPFSRYVLCCVADQAAPIFRSATAVSSTALLRPIVQSYVMKGCELNKFGTCHMSFGPMNILKVHRK